MQSTIIKCPNCGAEYTIEEIFYPEDLFSKIRTCVKDSDGKILHTDFIEEAPLTQTYCCDYCDKEFTTTLSIKAETKTDNFFKEEF